MGTKNYTKYSEIEKFERGDLISFYPNTSLVTRSNTKHYKHKDKLVLGICMKDNGKTVEIIDEGIVDVNVVGTICIGDRIAASNIAGKAKAIKYDNDEIRIFDIRPVGKIIGLYDDYSVAKVLLNIE